VLGDDWRLVRQDQYPGYHPELINRASAAPAPLTSGAPGGALWKERRVSIDEIKYAVDEVGDPYWQFPDLGDGEVLVLPSGTRVWRDPRTRAVWEEHPVAASVSRARGVTAGENVIPSAGEMGPGQAETHRAHGAASPGLGFDSPYSIARAPKEVNLEIEAAGIEKWVRGLRDNAPEGVQYLFTTGTVSSTQSQAGALIERSYKVSASKGGKIVDLATFKVTVGPANKVTLEVLDVFEEPMKSLGTPGNVDIPAALREKLGYEIGASKTPKVAAALSDVARRNQLVGIRLGDLYTRLAVQGKSAELAAIERGQDAVADIEKFLASASPSDPRVERLDAELRDMVSRVGKWQIQADSARLESFIAAVHEILGQT